MFYQCEYTGSSTALVYQIKIAEISSLSMVLDQKPAAWNINQGEN